MQQKPISSPTGGLWADLRRHGYFYYSMLLCCYSAMFATTVFFVPYYVELGYSNSRIGIIMAANSAMASIFPPMLGLLSDKLRSKRKTLLFCLAGLGLTALCVPVVGRQFLLTLLIAALYNGLRYSTVSIGETWAMSEVNRAVGLGSRMTYGSVRAWGSLGYSFTCLAYYFCLNGTGASNALTMYGGAVLALLTFIIALSGKKMEHTEASSGTVSARALSMKELKPGRLFKNYYYLTFLVVYVLMSCSMNFGQNYMSQLMEAVGGNAAFTGVLNFVRSFLEIPLLFLSPLLVRKLGYRTSLMISCAAFVAEQFFYIFAGGAVGVLLGQVIRGLSCGIMFSCAVAYIYSLVPRSLTATAQSICAGCNNIVSMLANLAGGFLIDALGIRSIFWVSAGIQLAAVVLFSASLLLGRLRGIKPYEAADDPVEQALSAQAGC